MIMEKVKNKPTKQDYLDIMYDALKQFKKEEYTTINLMTKYIMSKFQNLTPEDERNIRLTVYETFLTLKNSGYFKARKFNEYKATDKKLCEVKLYIEGKKVIDSKNIIIETSSDNALEK